MFTTIARETGRAVTVDEVRPAAVAALEAVFGLRLPPWQDGLARTIDTIFSAAATPALRTAG